MRVHRVQQLEAATSVRHYDEGPRNCELARIVWGSTRNDILGALYKSFVVHAGDRT
jgi:hypothetical protein